MNEFNNEQKNDENLVNWYSTPTASPVKQKSKWGAIFVALGLVVALVFGFLLGFVSNARQPIDITDQSEQQQLLTTVLEYLRDNYYKELTDEEWIKAIAAGGTNILQGAGDKYGHLLSPQEYYNLMNPTSGFDGNTTYFGVSYTYTAGLGLVVSGAETDGSCYGVLTGGDIITKLTNMKAKNDQPVVVDGVTYTEIVPGDYTSDEVVAILAKTNKATFHFFRDGELKTVDIERGLIGFAQNPFDYIEYYFDSQHNNISVTPLNNATNSTYALRCLSNIDNTDIGYIRITEFESTSYSEFEQVIKAFARCGKKRLILDLKGNPGGSVQAVTNIAGCLCTSDTLSADDKNTVEIGKKLLITTLKTRTMGNEQYTAVSSYDDYFALPNNGKCNIVVWTDGNSASASELLTGALRDYQTGFQIGTTTYGKGIAQSVVPLNDFYGDIVRNDGSTGRGAWAIYYTVANYYSPLDTNIHGVGYTPSADYNHITDYPTLWTKTLQYWAN